MEFYSQQEMARRGRTAQVWFGIICATALLALLGCIYFCCCWTTAKAAQLERDTIILSTVAGWFFIAIWTGVVLPQYRARIHERNILCEARETLTGVICVEPEVLQIPRSIAICKVVLNGAGRTQRLSVRADRAKYLKPLAGKRLNLQIVHGYIAAFEECHETD